MGTKIFVAVMHCTPQEPEMVIELASSILQKMFANTTEYPEPPETSAVLQAKVEAAVNTQSLVKNGGKQEKADRDKEIKELYAMLEDTFLPYPNKLYKGNKQKLLLSGFEVSKEPEACPIPEAAVIRKILPGPEPHSAKIYLARSTSPLRKTYGQITYLVLMAMEDGPDENFRQVLLTTNQFKLVVTGLVRGKEYIFTVACRNSRGSAELAGKVKFIAT